MKRYRYAARRSPQDLEEGTLQAESEEAVARALSGRGLFPVRVEVVESDDPGRKTLRNPFRKRGWGARDQALFARQVADLLEGGLTVDGAIKILEDQASDAASATILRSLREAVREGRSLSSALQAHPEHFPASLAQAVHAGEASGALESVLHRTADLLEREDLTMRKVQEAVTYPTLVAVVGLITLAVLFTYVVPRITVLYEDFGQVLPLPTRLLLAMSNIATFVIPLAGLGIVAAVLAWRRWRRTASGRITWGRLLFRLPAVGRALLLRESIRFSRLLGTLVAGGVPVLESLALSASAAANAHYAEEVRSVRRDVHEGSRLGSALANREMFAGPLVGMVRVGEQSGDLPSALERVAVLFERELESRLQRLTTLLEPVLIVALGISVGFVVFAMLLPILQLDLAA